MTEKEAIEIINKNLYHGNLVLALEIAKSSMMEIQQYRAIGTVEEYREAVERQRARKPEKELRDLENNPEIDCYGINELNNACARAADAIEALSAKMQAVNMETGSRWIPVEVRLPEDFQRVLVWYEYFRYGDYNCMYQTFGIGYQIDGHWSGSVSGHKARCIAWQPLPEPYRSKPKEGKAYE